MFRALEAVDIGDREEFASALRLVLCSSREEQALFDTLFERFLLAAESDAGGRSIQLIPEEGAAEEKGERKAPPGRAAFPPGRGKKPSGRKGKSRDRSGPGRKGIRVPEGRRRVPGEEAGRRIRQAGRRSGMFPSRGWPATAPTVCPGDRPPKSPRTAWRR